MGGWGGGQMQKAGVEIFTGLEDHSIMGFWEVARQLPRIRKLFKKAKSDILAFSPDVVVLVDYPGFNLRLAKWLKKHHFKVAWYISPQLWAWHPGRAETIRKYVDLMMVILPFEVPFYAERGITAHFVGHPLLDIIPEKNLLTDTKEHIALLPGSRKQEIERMLPVMLELARLLPAEKFIVAGMGTAVAELYNAFPMPANVEIEYNNTASILRSARAAVVTSGTATLETALYGTPQVVVYKAGRISYILGRLLVKVPFISLVNLIAGKAVVAELIQGKCTPSEILLHLQPLLQDGLARSEIKANYAELRKHLGEPGASKKAAMLLHEFATK